MSKVNKTSFLVRHKSCECKRRLNENLYNTRQKQNHDKFLYPSFLKDDYMWSSSACDDECDKACGIGGYLDVKKCSWKKVY